MFVKKYSFAFIISCLLYTTLSAQVGTTAFSGTITDGTGQPLTGANVIIRALSKGTVADENGFFTIKGVISGKQIVDFTFIGFSSESRTIDFGKGLSKTINIVLQEETSELKDVTVTGKSQIQEVRELAYTVDVIKTEALYNTGADLNRVLNQSSGIRIREDGGLGSTFSFSLNGFSGKQVKFYMDGIPMDNFGSSLTPNNFPVNLADRVEIYKGVLPITLGSDALGGAVNIITRNTPNYLDVSYGFGSFNTHKAALNFARTDFNSGFTIRATAFLNYSNNNYLVDVEPIDLDTSQKLPEQEVERFHDHYRSGTAKLEVGVVSKPYADKLLFGLIASGNDKDIQTGVTMDQVFGARTSNSSAIIPTLKYRKEHLFTEGLDLSVYGAYNLARNQFIDTTRLRYNWLQDTRPTTSAELKRTQLINKDNEASVNSNLAYTLSESQGLSFNYLFTDFTRSSSDVEDPDNVTFLYPQQLRKQIMGLGWQFKNERFTANAFAKLYFLKAESFEDVQNGTGVPDYQQTNITTNNFGYGIAAAFFVIPRLQSKFSYEHTYRLPEAVELLGDGLFVRRNSDLRPESSDNINFGAKYDFETNGQNQFNAEVNYILRFSEDYIRLDQAQTQPIDRQYVNIGKVNTNGLEGAINYNWDNKITVSANVTYQRIIDKQKMLTSENLTGTTTTPNLNYGYRIPNIPFLFGNFNLDYALPINRDNGNSLNLGYSLNYVHEYFLTPNQLGSNNQDNIPTQLSHNLLASYAIKNGKFNISMEVRNLTNARLYDNYLLQKPGRSFFINLRYFLDKQLF